MSTSSETSTTPAKLEKNRGKFRQLLDKTNKEHPKPRDVQALANLLTGNKGLELWRDVLSAAQFAERAVIENFPAVLRVKECWKHRLSSLRKELGYVGAPLLEQLLIQQAALCWLKLSLVELHYSNVMKQSITLTFGMYWEKRIAELQIADATTKKFLFTSRRTGGMICEFKTAFTSAVRDAGLEDFRFHDLRHWFASRLNAAGADPYTIRDLLGHSTTTMSADYTHTSFERRRQAMADMSQSRSHLRERVALDYGKIPEKRDRISA